MNDGLKTLSLLAAAGLCILALIKIHKIEREEFEKTAKRCPTCNQVFRQ